MPPPTAIEPTTATEPTTSQPAWEIARLFPDQGHWREGDYLLLNRRTNRLVELRDGRVQVLAVPTRSHQRIVLALYNALLRFAQSIGSGEVLVAPYPLKLRPDRFREPDVIFVRGENAHRLGEQYAESADLVIEVVSDDNREHDLIVKRAEYAAAGIPEYWIVDPREREIIVLSLEGGAYVTDGPRRSGEKAVSHLLHGFEVDVDEVLAAATRPT